MPRTDRWAIDGTVLEATNGSLYFIWSGWPGTSDGLQNLYIAPMSNPWTISGPRVLLSTPQLSWESWIQEGPEVLQRNGKVFVVYAANQSWTDNECLGMLVNTRRQLPEPGLVDQAVAAGLQDLSRAPTARCTGRAIAASPNRSTARKTGSSITPRQYSGAGWTRNIRMQRFTWDANGYPNFGQPDPGRQCPLPILPATISPPPASASRAAERWPRAGDRHARPFRC